MTSRFDALRHTHDAFLLLEPSSTAIKEMVKQGIPEHYKIDGQHGFCGGCGTSLPTIYTIAKQMGMFLVPTVLPGRHRLIHPDGKHVWNLDTYFDSEDQWTCELCYKSIPARPPTKQQSIAANELTVTRLKEKVEYK